MNHIIKSIEILIQKSLSVKHPELELSLGQVVDGCFQPGVSFDHFNTLSKLLLSCSTLRSRTFHSINYLYTDGIRSRHIVGSAPVFERKVTLDQFQFYCEERSLWVRVKLSAEIPENKKKERPSSVRLIQRQQSVAADFVIDLSKTVIGKTKVAACKNTPTFEIELEVTNFQVTGETILQKLSSLIGKYDVNGVRVDLTFVESDRLAKNV